MAQCLVGSHWSTQHAITMNSSFTFEVGGEPPSSQPAWDLGGALLAICCRIRVNAAALDGQAPFSLADAMHR